MATDLAGELAQDGTETSPPNQSHSESTRPPTVTARAILLALILLPINAYWVVAMEFQRYSAHPTTVSLFFNCIFFLVVLTGINNLVGKVRQSWRFSQGELLLIYSMLCIGSCMASHDFGQVLVTSIAYPFTQANHTNNYAELFWQYLPKWAMVSDIKATEGFYRGHSTLYTADHLRAWIGPALVWTAFVSVLFWVMICVNVIIRKQWTDSERLGYPLVKMPLELTASQPGGSGVSGIPLTKNRLFWGGFLLAATIDAVNSLNYYYPSVPSILAPGNGQSVFDLHIFFVNKPWTAVGWTPVTFYPFLIGLGMLLPMDFLFSAWFFYIFWKLEAVFSLAAGWDADPRMPYANYQSLGAYLLFFTSTFWLSRRYFVQVWKCAIGRKSELDDADEPLRYRNALLGIVVGLAILIMFCNVLGLSIWIAILFFVLYLALALAITRMRAEMGTPVHDLHFTGPDWTLSDLLGPRVIGAHGLAVFSLFYFFNRAYRSHPMPFQLEALKMAEVTGRRKEMKGWIFALLLACVVGMVSAFWALLHNTYIYGNTNLWMGTEPWDRYASWLTSPKPPNLTVAGAIAIGFALAAVMQAIRSQGIWCPFHPLAFAVSSSWEINLLWMPLFIAWATKGLILKYGGGTTYQKSLPFFYGLILGQFIPGSLLNIWGILTDTPTYQFWQ